MWSIKLLDSKYVYSRKYVVWKCDLKNINKNGNDNNNNNNTIIHNNDKNNNITAKVIHVALFRMKQLPIIISLKEKTLAHIQMDSSQLASLETARLGHS